MTALPRALVLASFAFAGASGHAADAPTTRCDFVAFVDETDPAGLNVRASPDVRSKVLGTLPPVWVDPAHALRVRVRTEVTDAVNGWFKIRNAVDDEDLTGRSARPVYSDEGWVSGRKLIVMTEASQGRQRPDTVSPVVLTLGASLSFDAKVLAPARHLVGCHGAWVEMTLDLKMLDRPTRAAIDIASDPPPKAPALVRFWVDKICGLQETSCDGL